MGSSRKLSQLPPPGELAGVPAGVDTLGGNSRGTGRKLGLGDITETSGDLDGVSGLPA